MYEGINAHIINMRKWDNGKVNLKQSTDNYLFLKSCSMSCIFSFLLGEGVGLEGERREKTYEDQLVNSE